jgi:hypothetical protein
MTLRARSKPVLEYMCPGCGARYDTLQAAYLIDFADGQFHCEACGAVLASAEDARSGRGGEGARQERLRATKALQAGVVVLLFPPGHPCRKRLHAVPALRLLLCITHDVC